MDSENLYRVQREDLPKLEKLLNLCFAHDPLYETLIPNAEIRKKLMPELFHCDMDEFYETCEIFADSEELNSISNKRRSVSAHILQFYQGRRLSELELDGSASSESQAPRDLSGS